MLYSKTSVINNTNLRRFVEVLQELELKDAGKQNAMDLKMNAEGSELFADDSGNILDEFLTEIENLIECKVFFFSSLNQTMQPRKRIGGFWISEKRATAYHAKKFTDGHCYMQIM